MPGERTSSKTGPASRQIVVLTVAGLVLASACERAPVGLDSERAGAPTSAAAQHQQVGSSLFRRLTALAGGYGHFYNPAFDSEFRFLFNAQQWGASSSATGSYHFWGKTADGKVIDLHGRVQCMNKDPENPGRAWLGGVITRNGSTHASFTGESSRVGRDAWFRVVDYGHGKTASQADRTTSIFVEPTGGFTRAQDFCDSLLWLDGDLFTNALLGGSIHVIHLNRS